MAELEVEQMETMWEVDFVVALEMESVKEIQPVVDVDLEGMELVEEGNLLMKWTRLRWRRCNLSFRSTWW